MDKKEEKIFSRYRIKIPNVKFIKLRDDRNLRKITTIIAILVIAIIVVKTVTKAITPIIDEQCKALAKNIATKVSNEQATNVMADYEYDDLCTIIKDEENNVKMIKTNMVTINKIISDIPLLIQKEMEKDVNSSFNLKLRKFFG